MATNARASKWNRAYITAIPYRDGPGLPLSTSVTVTYGWLAARAAGGGTGAGQAGPRLWPRHAHAWSRDWPEAAADVDAPVPLAVL